MKTILRLLLVLAVLAVAHETQAQQGQQAPAPSFLVVNQFKVAMNDDAQFNALSDSVFVPTLNALMKEGKLAGWGQVTHAWGDEWNQSVYYITQNHEAFLDFWQEFTGRVAKQYPGSFEKFGKLVQEHRDNMYVLRNAMQLKPVPSGSFLVLHQNKVALKDVGRANALIDSLSKSVLDEMVKEGKLLAWGQYNHAWGGEWNYNFYYIAENHRAFLSAWREMGARFNKRAPDWGKDLLPLILDHKDDMYNMRKVGAAQ